MLTLKAQGDMFGAVSISFADSGIRFRGKLGYALWPASRPEIVVMMNPENSTFLEVPAQEYFFRYRQHFKDIKLENIQRSLVNLENNRKGIQISTFAKRGKNLIKTAEIICLKTVHPPSRDVHRMWCRMLGLPDDFSEGFPISVRQKGTLQYLPFTQKVKDGLLTALEAKEVLVEPLDPKIFKVMKNYRQVPDRAALYFSQGDGLKKNDIEEFFMQPLDGKN